LGCCLLCCRCWRGGRLGGRGGRGTGGCRRDGVYLVEGYGVGYDLAGGVGDDGSELCARPPVGAVVGLADEEVARGRGEAVVVEAAALPVVVELGRRRGGDGLEERSATAKRAADRTNHTSSGRAVAAEDGEISPESMKPRKGSTRRSVAEDGPAVPLR